MTTTATKYLIHFNLVSIPVSNIMGSVVEGLSSIIS